MHWILWNLIPSWFPLWYCHGKHDLDMSPMLNEVYHNWFTICIPVIIGTHVWNRIRSSSDSFCVQSCFVKGVSNPHDMPVALASAALVEKCRCNKIKGRCGEAFIHLTPILQLNKSTSAGIWLWDHHNEYVLGSTMPKSLSHERSVLSTLQLFRLPQKGMFCTTDTSKFLPELSPTPPESLLLLLFGILLAKCVLKMHLIYDDHLNMHLMYNILWCQLAVSWYPW